MYASQNTVSNNKIANEFEKADSKLKVSAASLKNGKNSKSQIDQMDKDYLGSVDIMEQ